MGYKGPCGRGCEDRRREEGVINWPSESVQCLRLEAAPSISRRSSSEGEVGAAWSLDAVSSQ